MSEKSAKTFVFFIDALSYNYFTSDNMPNLFKLKDSWNVNKINTIFGFTNIGHAFLNGTLTNKNKIWTDFKFTNKKFNFPFFVNNVFNLIFKKSEFLTKLINLVISNFDSKILKNPTKTYAYPIDPRVLPYINFSYSKNIEQSKNSIFFLMKKKKLKYSLVNWPRSKEGFSKQHSIFKKILSKENDTNFYFMKILDLDTFGHKFGFDNSLKHYINRLDNLVAKFISEIQLKYENANIIIFSDHGMTDVNIKLNLKLLVDHLHDKFGFFPYFIDSTLLRLNPELNLVEKVEKEINKYIKEKNILNFISILSDEELNKEQIYFEGFRNVYGRIILNIQQLQTVNYPDFFRTKDAPKGMHGYLKRTDNLKGILISNRKFSNQKEIEYLDLYKLFVDLINKME